MILSGTGTNGSAGAQAVKAAGGLCMAQDPEQAEFPGMPHSLIHAGYADQVLPVGRDSRRAASVTSSTRFSTCMRRRVRAPRNWSGSGST